MVTIDNCHGLISDSDEHDVKIKRKETFCKTQCPTCPSLFLVFGVFLVFSPQCSVVTER